MPLAVEIVLIAIGVLLLAAALIGSGISRRLMTIPKMHRAPRIALAILGVLLLAGGMWGVATETEKRGPSMAELETHVPSDIKAAMDCSEAAEVPKGAAGIECTSTDENTTPEAAWITMFPDVDSMQQYWLHKADPSDLPGAECSSVDDVKKGSKQEWILGDNTVTMGDQACYMAGNTAIAIYTDRRFNIVVFAQDSNPRHHADFLKWLNGNGSVPEGDENKAPATPSHTVARSGQ
ncbi:hypothetical protein C3492_24735 [Streptomyces sp. Ru62]|uniref:tetraspanin family protein n=1 Tax=Streptomyces sp. Ru62 TaxID=2080745 RepID=UPI000CDDF9BB|nr:tetraspanin family protein [Streptomyces sp. Ru62]POX60896.1 hypothetical protein C3492_24735 [Streptomyces sp. Ru62]